MFCGATSSKFRFLTNCFGRNIFFISIISIVLEYSMMGSMPLFCSSDNTQNHSIEIFHFRLKHMPNNA